jgi:hypothetical protein
MLPLNALVECIPRSFSGVLDLCVCHPDDLVTLLLRDRQLCTVRYLSNRANPIFWLAFYAGIYQMLALDKGLTYSEAQTELAIQLRHKSEGETDE